GGRRAFPGAAAARSLRRRRRGRRPPACGPRRAVRPGGERGRPPGARRGGAPGAPRGVSPLLRARRGGVDRGDGGEPLRLLAGGSYDVCIWIPYPHQNLGVLAAAVGDLQEVAAATARLSAGEPAPLAKEPDEAPTFAPFGG